MPIDAGGHIELALNGENFVAGYDPATGKANCGSARASPAEASRSTLARRCSVLYVVNGLAGDMYAVKPGGSGDVTKTHMLWHTPRRGGRDGPSPLLINGFLIVSNMGGIGSCYEAATGKELWKTRLGDDKISASPIAAAGHAYLLFENGETLVIDPGPGDERNRPQYRRPSRRRDLPQASPVPWNGHLLIRSDQVLYCVGSREVERTELNSARDSSRSSAAGALTGGRSSTRR